MRLTKGTSGTAHGGRILLLISIQKAPISVLTYRLRTESYEETAYNFYLVKYRRGQKHFIPLSKRLLLFLKGGKKKPKEMFGLF